MSKKLTEAQKAARRIIREATKRVIAEVDSSDWRKMAVEFRADFHLACIRYDCGTAFGQPIEMSHPIYKHVR